MSVCIRISKFFIILICTILFIFGLQMALERWNALGEYIIQ
jgi:hypothetical protein